MEAELQDLRARHAALVEENEQLATRIKILEAFRRTAAAGLLEIEDAASATAKQIAFSDDNKPDA